MEENQQKLRRAAAEAFMESLEALGHTLQSCEHEQTAPNSTPESTSEPAPAHHSLLQCTTSVTVEELESAAADIEQFMQTQHSPTPTTPHTHT